MLFFIFLMRNLLGKNNFQLIFFMKFYEKFDFSEGFENRI